MSFDKKTRLDNSGFIWDPLEWSWQKQYRQLCAYRHEHGTTTDNWPEEFNGWMSSQRKRKENGTLSNEKVAQLEAMGFVWSFRNSAWQERVEELRVYIEKHGNADVPQREPSGLGAWLNTRRKEEKSGNLSQERKAILEKMGVQWNPVGDKWGSMYELLLAYRDEHGTTDVPINGTTDLDAWVGRQRKAKKNKTLSQDRISLLDDAGFDWDPFASQWETMFKELLAYRLANRHVNVPQRPLTSLGRWVRVQRESLKNGRLTSNHRFRLDEIGFVWNMRADPDMGTGELDEQ